ncbi:MAG: trehalose-phosphatase [Nitriliruptorales bacterium]
MTSDATERHARSIAALPSAPDNLDTLAARFAGRRAAVFLDYDGTLTPIVEDAAAATIDDAARDAIRELAAVCTVAVVSGRDLDDVRGMVGVEGIHYAGSHGFDILAPDGGRTQKGRGFLLDLDAAEAELRARIGGVPGARLERKRFAIAVHFRQVDPARVEEVKAAVEEVGAVQARLRVTGGKMILELRPDIDWDKGRALAWLLDELDLDDPGVVPLYVGDDETDEDAFRELRGRGIGIVVRGEDDDRPTLADLALDDPAQAVRFLRDLRGLLEDSG